MPLIAPRLPGVGFVAEAPPRDEPLPRMDVAVFVGFATAGPLHVPVVGEDADAFREIFGPDLYLGVAPADDAAEPDAALNARGRGTAREVYGYLGSAVRQFFGNGGRRCWVIRVAGKGARRLRLPVPGLLALDVDGDTGFGAVPGARPAAAQARSEGRWAEAVALGSALLSEPLGRALSVSADGATFVVRLAADATIATETVAAADLLRITFDDGRSAYAVVAATEIDPADDTGATLRLTCHPAVWMAPPVSAGAGAVAVVAHVIAVPGGADGAPAVSPPSSPPRRYDAALSSPEAGMWALELAPAYDGLPTSIVWGSWIRADLGDRQLWLNVIDTDLLPAVGSPPEARLKVTGRGAWLAPPQVPPAGERPLVERLRFELWARHGGDPLRLSRLGFASGHAAFWGDLPTDEELFRDPVDAPERRDLRRSQQSALWRAAADPRFPAAGERPAEGRAPPLYLPIGMPPVPDLFVAPPPQPPPAAADDDPDGLGTFDEWLFLDRGLADATAVDLMARADFIRYQSHTPRPLLGLYAALGVAEGTLVAVPDAVHTGWDWVVDEDTLGLEPSAYQPLAKDDERAFRDCEAVNLAAPQIDLAGSGRADGTGRINIAWDASGTPAAATFVLEEFTHPDASDAALVYAGRETRAAMFGRGEGTWFYRVRSVMGCEQSPWSWYLRVPGARQATRQMLRPNEWGRTSPPGRYDPATLLAVQRALLRACAARGDLLAVLSLPRHYREEESLGHAAGLRSRALGRSGSGTQPRTRPSRPFVLPLNEPAALSYGAMYHPWPVVSDDARADGLDAMPPDGVACGLIAGRSIRRGAWVAPANELLNGVVSLDPPIAVSRRLDLQEGRVNLLRREPRGFVVLDEDTLSEDPDLRPVNVRRLLILLRKLALRLGEGYVFEPNSGSFRRAVRRAFERVLSDLLVRGAFAGATADQSYRVATDSSLNTPRSVDLGRFVVEVRVAPSLPLRFLTVRLVRTGDSGFDVEGD